MKQYPYRLVFLNQHVTGQLVKQQAHEELDHLGKVTIMKWEVENVMNFTANTMQGDLPWSQIKVTLTYTVE